MRRQARMARAAPLVTAASDRARYTAAMHEFMFIVLWFVPVSQVGIDLGVQLDSLRCGREVVAVGDRSWHVLEACGEPDYREVVELRRATVAVEGPEGTRRFDLGLDSVQVVEEWIYRPRSGKLTRFLIVTGGILTDIRLGDRN